MRAYTMEPVFNAYFNGPEKNVYMISVPSSQHASLTKHPLVTGCPLIGVFLEDRLYCINKPWRNTEISAINIEPYF